MVTGVVNSIQAPTLPPSFIISLPPLAALLISVACSPWTPDAVRNIKLEKKGNAHGLWQENALWNVGGGLCPATSSPQLARRSGRRADDGGHTRASHIGPPLMQYISSY
jgi:hypothetical protein